MVFRNPERRKTARVRDLGEANDLEEPVPSGAGAGRVVVHYRERTELQRVEDRPRVEGVSRPVGRIVPDRTKSSRGLVPS